MSITRRMGFAVVLAGSVLLTPQSGRATTQGGKQGDSAAATSSSSGRPKKVSPYVTFNKRRLEESRKQQEHSKKGAPTQTHRNPLTLHKH